MKRNWLIAILLILGLISSVDAATISGSGITAKEEGGTLGTATSTDCVGGGINCTFDSGELTINVSQAEAPQPNYYVAGHMSPMELIAPTTYPLDPSLWGTAKLGAYAFNSNGGSYGEVRHISDIDPTTAWTVDAWVKHNINKGELLLHMDGSDGTTTFTNSGTGSHTMTAVGNAQIDTAQSKFGGASGLFDGDGDWLTTPDHTDFDFSGGIWTISLQVRTPSLATNSGLFSQENDDNNYTAAHIATNGHIIFNINSGGSDVVYIETTSALSIDTMYHVEFVENGDNYYIFVNGVLWASATDTDRPANYTGVFYIGNYAIANNEIEGWIDEFRTMKGIAYHLGTFTAPTSAYPLEYNSNLLIASKYDNVAGKGGYSVEIDSDLHLVGKHWSGISSENCTGTTALSAGTWYHVVVTYDTGSPTGTLVCYVNGTAENTNSSVTGTDYSSTNVLTIGGYASIVVDELAIWNITLSGATTPTIAQRYNGGSGAELAGTETNLEAVWHFNEGEGTLAYQSVNQTGIGSDSNDCLTYTTPCKTIQAVIDKLPKFYSGSSTIHIASGVYPETVTMSGHHPSGNYFITLIGYINSTPNNFNYSGGTPNDVAQSSGTSTGSNTANYPLDSRSLFNDTGANFSNIVEGQLLKLTAGAVCGTGYNQANWYRIEKAISTTQLSVVTKWGTEEGVAGRYVNYDGCGTIPGVSTTYEIYYEKYMAEINGGSREFHYNDTTSSYKRRYGLMVENSEGIIIRKLAVNSNGRYNIYLPTSNIKELSAVAANHAGFAGIRTFATNIESVVANNYSYNWSIGFSIQNASSALYVIKNIGIGTLAPSTNCIMGAFSSDALHMSINLCKNNGIREYDFENNFNTAAFDWNRADCSDNTDSDVGLSIFGASSVSMNYINVFNGNVNSIGIVIGDISSTMIMARTPSDIRLQNNDVGIFAYNMSCSTPLSNSCSEFTYSGNTKDLLIGTILEASNDTPSSPGTNKVLLYLDESVNRGIDGWLTFASASSEYVDIANESKFDFDYNTAFSISAWVKTTNTANAAIVAKYTTEGYSFRMNAAGKLVAYLYDGVGSINKSTTDASINDNSWHHVAMTKTTSNAAVDVLLYIDGVEITSTTVITDTLTASMLNDGNLQIGAAYSGALQLWNGSIDNVALFNTTLTLSEIQTLCGWTGSVCTPTTSAAYSSLTGGEVGLVSGFNFNEGFGLITMDAKAINNGVLVNTPTWTNADIADCALVARLSSGVEKVIDIIVNNGGCP